MSHAKCKECGQQVSWSARRGTRLAELRCYRCGGELEGLTTGRRSPAAGKHYAVCEICGKRGLALIRLPESRTVYWWGEAKVVEAGAPIHGHHELRISAEEQAILYHDVDPLLRVTFAYARDVLRMLSIGKTASVKTA